MKRLGVVGIVVEDRDVASEVQKVLSENSEIILGRMGLPDRESGFRQFPSSSKAASRKYPRSPGNSAKSKTFS